MEQLKGKTTLSAVPGFSFVGDRLVGSGDLRAEQDAQRGAQEQSGAETTRSEKTPLELDIL